MNGFHEMCQRIIVVVAMFFLPLSVATPSVPAQTIGQGDQTEGGRWSTGLYSTRDLLERNGPHALVDLAIVRKELRITKDQAADLTALKAKAQENGIGRFNVSAKDLNGQDPKAARLAKYLELYDQQQEAINLETSRILNPAQNRRLREISLQLEGILAVARPEIQEALNMDQSQKLNVTEIKRKYKQSQIAFYRKNAEIVREDRPKSKAEADELLANKDRPEVRKKQAGRNAQFDENKAEFDALRTRAEAQVKRWLTRRQEEKFKKLCGEPFKELEMMGIPGFDWKREDLRREKEGS